jgi:uncharacterized protein involved in exopolysaccharide biosynthesis
MTDIQVHDSRTDDDDQYAVFAVAAALLRWRVRILGLAALGAASGLLTGLLSRRTYVSEATFLPQMSEVNLSGLALAASQLGVRLPTATGAAWGPPVYVDLLQSRGLLEPIVRDTLVVAEEGGQRIAVLDLLRVKAPKSEVRVDRGVQALREIVSSQEMKALGGVKVRVTTRWPSVSYAIAQRLVDAVQRFNVETRQSQAGAERRFVEARADEAEHTLREAEDRLQSFLQRNRSITGSPELSFQLDRLQREVTLRQQLYTGLLQSREEARVREVRDTPVITVVEEPLLPALPAPRRAVLKAIAGGLAGGILAVAIAFVARGLIRARRTANGEVLDFFKLLDEARPRWTRRKAL